MKSVRAYSSLLRQQQAEDTRSRIVDAALDAIAEQPDEALSHEQLAGRAGIALRTVYRYFPSHPELLDAVWQESDRRLQLAAYPSTEEEMLAAVETVFRKLDENASLIRGLLHSDAGREMRARDNDRRLAGVSEALKGATQHLQPKERRGVIGIFQVLFSGRAWEMLRDRAHLKEGEASRATTWAMQTLLGALYRDQARLDAQKKKGKRK